MKSILKILIVIFVSPYFCNLRNMQCPKCHRSHRSEYCLKCNHCGRFGHRTQQCWHCSKCNEYGHRTQQCWHCSKCDVYGHTDDRCPVENRRIRQEEQRRVWTERRDALKAEQTALKAKQTAFLEKIPKTYETNEVSEADGITISHIIEMDCLFSEEKVPESIIHWFLVSTRDKVKRSEMLNFIIRKIGEAKHRKEIWISLQLINFISYLFPVFFKTTLLEEYHMFGDMLKFCNLFVVTPSFSSYRGICYKGDKGFYDSIPGNGILFGRNCEAYIKEAMPKLVVWHDESRIVNIYYPLNLKWEEAKRRNSSVEEAPSTSE